MTGQPYASHLCRLDPLRFRKVVDLDTNDSLASTRSAVTSRLCFRRLCYLTPPPPPECGI